MNANIIPVLLVPIACSLLQIFLRRTKVTTYEWIVFILSVLICGHLVLITLAAAIQSNEIQTCLQEGREIVSTGLSGWCPSARAERNAFENIIVRSFGGTFDGAFTLLIGTPLVLIMSLVGLFRHRMTWSERLQTLYAVIIILLPLSILCVFAFGET
jgi:hypothetical protein